MKLSLFVLLATAAVIDAAIDGGNNLNDDYTRRSSEGSCSLAGRCCSGRDSSCYGRGGHRACYCDEGCLETGDCCKDYKQTCEVKGEQ